MNSLGDPTLYKGKGGLQGYTLSVLQNAQGKFNTTEVEHSVAQMFCQALKNPY